MVRRERSWCGAEARAPVAWGRASRLIAESGRRYFRNGLMLAVLLVLGACGRTQRAPDDAPMGGAGDSGDSGGSGGSSNSGGSGSTTDHATSTGGSVSTTDAGATGGSGGVAGSAGETCVEEAYPQKRLVRLSFYQIVNSVRAWFGDELADQLVLEHELDVTEREHPPLAGAGEGSVFIEPIWSTSDAIARAVGQYVEDNFEAVTGCGPEPTQACATDYLAALAEKAYRRPLSAEERESVLAVFSKVRATEASVAQSTNFGVYAVMSAPQVLYRSEFGSDVTADEPLTLLERASQLSYFITDAPPDAELLEAAEQGALQDESAWREQARRLLGTPQAQQNLSAALVGLFGLQRLRNIVIDPAVAPGFGDELRNSMFREAQWLAGQVWQGGPIEDLLTSRESYLNEPLAALYGVDFPPSNGSVDADGFARVTLPDVRSGMLTNAGFLATMSRSDTTSVVGRGLQVMANFTCDEQPIFPELSDDPSLEIPPGATEREKAEARMQAAACADCHTLIDPYGLALEGFDLIGRYRTTDLQGRPIDTQVTLKDGTPVNGAVELAQYIVSDDRFAACFAKHWLQYGLADLGVQVEARCAAQGVVEALKETPRSFADLIAEVSISPVMTERVGGTAP